MHNQVSCKAVKMCAVFVGQSIEQASGESLRGYRKDKDPTTGPHPGREPAIRPREEGVCKGVALTISIPGCTW